MRVWKGQMIANQWSAFTVFQQEMTPWPRLMTLRPKVNSPGGQRALLRCWPQRRCHGNGTGRRKARCGVHEGRAVTLPVSDGVPSLDLVQLDIFFFSRQHCGITSDQIQQPSQCGFMQTARPQANEVTPFMKKLTFWKGINMLNSPFDSRVTRFPFRCENDLTEDTCF